MFNWWSKKKAFEIWIKDGERRIDLYPIAEEVIEKAPGTCTMDALRLAELARMGYFGAYIRVGEYPEDMDREFAKLLVRRVHNWARWITKEEGFRRTRFERWQIRTGHQPCPTMAARSGEVISPKQIERLPLDDCWRECQCWYSLCRSH